jgi:hypothetical protein
MQMIEKEKLDEIIVSTRKELERYSEVPASFTKKILQKGKVLYG